MKHKISLISRPPETTERNMLDSRDKNGFIFGAEEDYILCRILLLLGINDSGIYHYQQCIEKYLKSYLIEKDISFRNTHNLNRLIELCKPLDSFFKDEDLVDACDKVTPFEVTGRYPQTQIRAYGWTMPDLIHFLDEFVYEMRKKVDRKGITDAIAEMKKTRKIGFSDYDSSSLADLFFLDNPYFK